MKTFILSICIILFFISGHAQVKNIVFEGAGIRGIAYSGAISELENSGQLKGIERVGGTSAGAITALLVSLGYTSEEIRNIILTTPFHRFNQGRYFIAGGINRLQKNYGWFHAERVDQWIGELIQAKAGKADISFLELKQKGFKDLYVTGTCLNKQKLIIFSFEHYPHMKVRDAVRISMSIPLYFEPVFIDKEGRVVLHPESSRDLDIMIDGGFGANYPVHLFDSSKYFDPAIPNNSTYNTQTLGFRIDNDAQVESDKKRNGLAEIPIEKLDNYLLAFYTIIMEGMNRPALTARDWDRTISINDNYINPRIRKMPAKEVRSLISNGASATKEYFEKEKKKDPI